MVTDAAAGGPAAAGAASAASVSAVLQRIGRAIRGMDEPAVEKISEDSRDDPFQVLISTMLSAPSRARQLSWRPCRRRESRN
jgi:hypothetical protein